MIRASSSQDNYLRSSMVTLYPRVRTNEPKDKEGSHPSAGHQCQHSSGKLEFGSKTSPRNKSQAKLCTDLSSAGTKAPENGKASHMSEVANLERTVREMQLQALQHKQTVSKQQSELRTAQSEISALKTQVEQQQSSLDQLTNKNLDLTLQHESDRETIAHLEAILMTLQNCGFETSTLTRMAEGATPLTPGQAPSLSIACTGESDIWNESLSCLHESTKSCDEWSYSSNNSLNTLELDEVQSSSYSRQNSSVPAVDSSDSVKLRQDVQDILQTETDIATVEKCTLSGDVKIWSPTSCMNPFEDEDSTDFVLGINFLDESTASLFTEGSNEFSRERARRLPKAA